MSLEKKRDLLKNTSPGYFFLFLLSGVYLLAVKAREYAYSSGILKRSKAARPVICFGNISAGGTGKTSTVIMAALELKKMKKKPAIIMRGYKSGSKAKAPLLAGSGAPGPDPAGDEAAIIHAALKEEGIPVVVAPDRPRAAAFALEKFDSDVILMDDGFQHFALKRDLDVVLLNSSAPADERLLPLGNLREPFSALKRAGLVILTHCENASEKKLDALKEKVRLANSEVPVLESMHLPECFLDPAKGKKLDAYALKGAEAVCLSAIGDPGSFESILVKLGVKLKKTWRFPDHYRFKMEDLKAVADTSDGLPVITTYKDFVRFPRTWDTVITSGLYIFSIKVSFLSNGYRLFVKKLLEVA